MNRVTVKRIGIVLGFAILAGAYAISNVLGNMKEPPKRKDTEKQVREVDVFAVENGTISNYLDIQGTLVAFDKIGIFAEVSGTLKPNGRPFKVGTYYPKGSLLVNVEDTEARLSILSQKSTLLNAITQMMPDLRIDYPESYEQWSAYLQNFKVEENLQAFPAPKNDREKLFIASRNLFSQYYSIQSAEERLSKYKVYSPFSGVLTNVSINPGALVRNGQQLGELMKTSEYELEGTLPLSDLKLIKVGNPVKLVSEDIDGEWQGKVRRISDQVDASSQTVKIFIAVSGQGLKEGMYLRGQISAPAIQNAIEIDRSLLIDNDQVYQVLNDTLLQLIKVQPLQIREKTAVIAGLPDDTQLLKNVFPNAFSGMKVKIKKAGAVQNEESTTSPIGELK